MQQLDGNVDTLIIAECVLAYLSPEASKRLLEALGRLLNRASAVCYEMCVAGDQRGSNDDGSPSRFGTVMLHNLQVSVKENRRTQAMCSALFSSKSRNLSMPGARAFATLKSHATRFEHTLNVCNTHVRGKGTAITLKSVWHDQSDEEKARLSRIERLDEVEELDMLLDHYAVSWYTHDAKSNASFMQPDL